MKNRGKNGESVELFERFSDDRSTRCWRLQSAGKRRGSRVGVRVASNDYRCIPEDPFRGLHLPDGTTASYQPYSFRTGSNTVGNRGKNEPAKTDAVRSVGLNDVRDKRDGERSVTSLAND
ncbi:hypothetical protein K0M31_017365 [Melipona bicolor]|uniref:Uncharacterized protein n=1 Tax=Melipona bicolor TaxID=60889 RepID=A0AA40KSD0_9HYME|nr:hypothetical protein K0M31_017365 [Melipona bicolor]